MNRTLSKSVLKNTEVTGTIAENGQIAVDEFMKNEFDIILTDTKMPVMNAYTATSKQATPLLTLKRPTRPLRRSRKNKGGQLQYSSRQTNEENNSF